MTIVVVDDELPLAVPGLDERAMLDRLRARHAPRLRPGNGPRWVYAEQVKSAPGFNAPRCLDAMALSCYASDDNALHGFEVKCRRVDVRRELLQPDKAGAFTPYLDYFWLVLSTDKLLRPSDDLPPDWGVMVANYGGLRVTRQARRNAHPEPLPRGLFATFTRAAVKVAEGQR